MDVVEARERLGFVPLCDCGHRAESHRDDGPCTGQDSYGAPCACLLYDVEPDAEL